MTLKLGSSPESLEVTYVLGEKFWAALRLKQDGAAEPWPAAPVLHIGTATFVSQIDPDDSSRAIWDVAQPDWAVVGTGGEAALKVDGVSWWKGVAFNV